MSPTPFYFLSPFLFLFLFSRRVVGVAVKEREGIGQVSLFDQEIDFLAELSARGGWPDPERLGSSLTFDTH